MSRLIYGINMVFGIPKEIKSGEQRVVLTPQDCSALISDGAEVHVESSAGILCGFEDSEYLQAGCKIEENSVSLYENSEIIIKVKEPQPQEIQKIKSSHTLFCFLHLGGNPQMAEELRQTGVRAYAFETVTKDNSAPILTPMSDIAGYLSVLMSANFIMTPYGGKGLLVGSHEHHEPGKILIIGLGNAGQSAVEVAVKLGIQVYAADILGTRLNEIQKKYPQVKTVISNKEGLTSILPEMDIIVGAIYVLGKKAPVIITNEDLRIIKKGSVLFDISIDQGGCFESSRPCTHEKPTFVSNGIVHSAITNLPSAVARTASIRLSREVLPYALELNQNIIGPGMQSGLNIENKEFKINF